MLESGSFSLQCPHRKNREEIAGNICKILFDKVPFFSPFLWKHLTVVHIDGSMHFYQGLVLFHLILLKELYSKPKHCVLIAIYL